MTERENRPDPEQRARPDDGRKDLAEHERPEVGLIGDEDLPEDLRPTDDNPLAKDPDDSEDADDAEEGEPRKLEDMPDMGGPGASG